MQEPSKVKLSDIYFKNIRGTSTSEVAVALDCSKGIPCQNIYLEDVHLKLSSGHKAATSMCRNVRAKFIGTQIPPPCLQFKLITIVINATLVVIFDHALNFVGSHLRLSIMLYAYLSTRSFYQIFHFCFLLEQKSQHKEIVGDLRFFGSLCR